MFIASFFEGLMLKKIVESIKDLVSDINLDINTTGISLQAMDNSHVALVVLTLDKDGFAVFKCEQRMTIGISMEHFHKVLKCATNDDTIVISTEDNPTHLNIKFENLKLKKKSEFNLSLKSFNGEHLCIPNNHYDSIITMNSNEFNRICRELYSLNETIIIETCKRVIKFCVLTKAIGGCIKLEENKELQDDSVIIEVYYPVFLAFSLKYLNMFSKAATLSNQLTLYLSAKFPLMIEYKIAEFGMLSFHLAPRIPDDDK